MNTHAAAQIAASKGRLALRAEIEHWAVIEPFHISGHVWRHLDVLLVSLSKDGKSGRGEAAGVYYNSDNPDRKSVV